MTPLPTLDDLEVKLDLRNGKWVLSKTTKAAIQRLFASERLEELHRVEQAASLYSDHSFDSLVIKTFLPNRIGELQQLIEVKGDV